LWEMVCNRRCLEWLARLPVFGCCSLPLPLVGVKDSFQEPLRRQLNWALSSSL
jgi:hypothetical protein